MNSTLKLTHNPKGIAMSTRTVFALLPVGTPFVFIGNPIPFTKDTDFRATGYRSYNKGGSFFVSILDKEFSTMAIVDIIDRVNVIGMGV